MKIIKNVNTHQVYRDLETLNYRNIFPSSFQKLLCSYTVIIREIVLLLETGKSFLI